MADSRSFPRKNVGRSLTTPPPRTNARWGRGWRGGGAAGQLSAMLSALVAALLAGLVGSPHCMGMCGGFAAACARPLRGAALWHAGRLATYAALGALAGALGGGVPGPAWVPAALAVPLLLWFSASLAGLVPAGPARVPGLARLGAALARRDGSGWRFLLGLATGLLPCGMVYAALALAVAAGSAAGGAATMIVFGLGTVPALALLAAGVRALALRTVWSRRALAVLVLVAGLFSVGMRLRPGAGRGHMHEGATPTAPAQPASPAGMPHH